MTMGSLLAIFSRTQNQPTELVPRIHRIRRVCGLFGALLALLGVLSSPAQAVGLPLVISATVDYAHGTLTITGQNFGSSPTVTLDAMTFPTQSASSSRIVANFPAGNPPSSFAPGTYFLTLQYRNQLPSIFTADIGANGAQGPAGVQGAAGPAGAPGGTGPAGPAGPQGMAGPIGPPGATGPAGPTGATGAQGAQGTQGNTGPQGPAGAGIPTCTKLNSHLVSANGTLVCQPRYVDNGDGTVTDNATGLMWEQTTDTCGGEVTCYFNEYTWSPAPGTPGDGTIFTSFIAGLNGGSYSSPSLGLELSTGPGTCLANHCDWRIPSIGELQLIVDAIASGCGSGSACIDSTFGPTRTANYWSSSSVATDPSEAWNVGFGNSGVFGANSKDNPSYARAVRGGR